MIRYPADEGTLKTDIEKHVPGWLQRARKRTRQFVRARRYTERSGIWSDVKPVYMTIQHDKCAYCERKLPSRDYGGVIEHDLEHYRPKSGVEAWPTPPIRLERKLAYSFSTGNDYASGYYWLAYHVLNYCVACKKCNTPLKLNYFPIAANRTSTRVEPSALNDVERPFLIFPLGEVDEHPEEIITFVGTLAVPKRKSGPRWRRAKVTIDFFELNRREELQRERAEVLVELDNALALLDSKASDVRKKNAEKDITRLRDASSRHASCARCACELYLRDRVKALTLFQEARDFLRSLLAQPTHLA
jgi:hypothetical protein